MGKLGDCRLYTAVANHAVVLDFMGLYAPKKPVRPMPSGLKTLKIKHMAWAKTFRPTFLRQTLANGFSVTVTGYRHTGQLE